ncbi:MAG: RHS repeat-associated core domain-containing protein [Flavobacteriales bacterium]
MHISHLGNVHVVVSDRKLAIDDGTYSGGTKINSTPDGIMDFYEPDVLSTTDYGPFGDILPGRNYNSSSYSYGFQGQLKTDEIKGSGNHYDFKFRGYDPRIGRMWSVDPLAKNFPWNSPYAIAENDVIRSIDLEGAEKLIKITNAQTGKSNVLTLKTSGQLGDGILEISQSVNGIASLQYTAPVNYNAKTGEVSGGGTTDISAYTAGRLGLGSALLSEGSVPQNVKSDMMRGIIHQGQSDFGMMAAEASAGALEQTGGYVSDAGVGISLVPGGQLFGVGLISLGEGMSNIGGLVQVGLDYKKGNKDKAAIKLGIMAGGKVLGDKLESMFEAGKITQTDQTILQGVGKMHEKAAEVVGDKATEEK